MYFPFTRQHSERPLGLDQRVVPNVTVVTEGKGEPVARQAFVAQRSLNLGCGAFSLLDGINQRQAVQPKPFGTQPDPLSDLANRSSTTNPFRRFALVFHHGTGQPPHRGDPVTTVTDGHLTTKGSTVPWDNRNPTPQLRTI
jgi:hypothetical protein